MKRWLLLLTSLCCSQALAEPLWKVTPDAVWDACFQRTQGWNGADGAYSVPLEPGWTGWLFSDTFVGEVKADGSRAPDNRFVHNSWARIRSTQPGQNLFSSQELVHAQSDSWYWVYQPVLNEQRQGYLFLGEFTTSEGPEGLNFRQIGTSLARLDWSGQAPLLSQIVSVPHFRAQPALNFGAAVLEAEEWSYVYATRDFGSKKEVLLARAPTGRLEQFDRWQFWPTWSNQVDQATPLLADASNELSVFWHKGEVRLLTQVGDEILLYRAPSPAVPFTQSVVLCRLPREDSVWTYNAKAHPEMGWPLLITYNRNAMPPQLVMDKADRYRPGCLRLSQDPWLP